LGRVAIREGEAVELTLPHQAPDGAIFRYFGLSDQLQFHYNEMHLEEEDRILLVSDGVTKVKHPREAAAIVTEYQDIAKAVNALAVATLAAGSNDDITALLLEVSDCWE
jgi:serine/threonine protein phosphatase PrpC